MNGAIALDARAGGLELLRRRLDRGGDLGVDGQADADVHHQADAQAGDVALEALPVDRLRRQAHRVAVVGLRENAHHQRRVGDGARHRPGDAAGVRRVDRDPAEARLQGEDAAPSGRQAHRAADVGAEVERPVAGGDAGGRARAAAARVLAQVPGVAGQAVEARQPRRQHPVVGHRRLAEDDRAGLAQARRRRRVALRRRQLGRRGAERHRRAGGRDVLLDHRRHAFERADVLAGADVAQPPRLGDARRGERGVGVERVGRVQVRLPGGDAVEHGTRHLDRRERALSVAGDELGRRQVVQGGHGVDRGAIARSSAPRSLAKIGELLQRPFSRLLATANCGSWNR